MVTGLGQIGTKLIKCNVDCITTFNIFKEDILLNRLNLEIFSVGQQLTHLKMYLFVCFSF
jgi:hypothetical protein